MGKDCVGKESDGTDEGKEGFRAARETGWISPHESSVICWGTGDDDTNRGTGEVERDMEWRYRKKKQMGSLLGN